MTYAIQLTRPVKNMGETLTQLQLREPTFKDLMALDAVDGEFARTALMIERLANVTPLCVENLAPVDVITRLKPAIDDFLLLGHPTGAPLSQMLPDTGAGNLTPPGP